MRFRKHFSLSKSSLLTQCIIELKIIQIGQNKFQFSGSASTGIASYGMGRIYLGIEMRSDYCQMSIERYRNFRPY